MITSELIGQMNQEKDSKSLQKFVEKLIDRSKRNKRRILIGIAGIPSSGKTTLAQLISKSFNHQVQCLPMDGFHIYKKDLDENEMKRRGAHFTFDSRLLYEKLSSIQEWKSSSKFPSFEHGVGDPIQDDIQVKKEHCVIFMEGLYMACNDEKSYWSKIHSTLDLVIYIDIPFDAAMNRLLKRHMKSWNISEEEAQKKIQQNDALNARFVLRTRKNATYIVSCLGHSVEEANDISNWIIEINRNLDNNENERMENTLDSKSIIIYN